MGDFIILLVRLTVAAVILSVAAGQTNSDANAAKGSKTTPPTQSPSTPPAETGPEAISAIHAGKYLADDQSCRSMLAKRLWGLSRSSDTWSTFDPNNLPSHPSPKMHPFLSFDCDRASVEVEHKPIILHGSLWRRGHEDGTWSQVASQWQVYRAIRSKDHRKGLLADGYRTPTKEDTLPELVARDKLYNPQFYHQPGLVRWPAKPALYNAKEARFVGVSCFYDWDGYVLEDPGLLKDLNLSYKINTVAVLPDNVNDLNSIIGALRFATNVGRVSEVPIIASTYEQVPGGK
jgi:hypothetical protein